MSDPRPDPGPIAELLRIMARLRDPDGGCPWDLEQDFGTIAPYTLEEAYEVVEAIGAGDPEQLRDELGDLLFQVVYHAQMAAERDWFGFADVVGAINAKMVRRHPHVFGDEVVEDAEAQSRAWERHKARERAGSGAGTAVLDGVPRALPALVRAQKLQRRAARVGFDWADPDGVVDKLQEELDELRAALGAGEGRRRVREELGDLLFSCANLARHLDADAEALLREANDKFERRFRAMEAQVPGGAAALASLSAAGLERLWQQAKDAERSDSGS
ncbi:MAG TPA: nucleoside triphosphate pyrophosphohydrolase [Gammaproteobacteria bacterium]|nr:nucleoside triphosphate pyrophosphohydrolase [Gammaproteobacteria bacterium]